MSLSWSEPATKKHNETVIRGRDENILQEWSFYKLADPQPVHRAASNMFVVTDVIGAVSVVA